MTSSQRPYSRLAFTLIELLVVIAIIAILLGLLVPAVMIFRGKPAQITTTSEISQLDVGIQNFKSDFKVPYIPSRIVLCEKFAEYGAPPNFASVLHKDSMQYLLQLWPHLADVGSPWLVGVVDWNGNGAYSPPVILEGDQCLVFFLGGIPVGNGTQNPSCFGFATDPRDPVKLAQAKGRKGPQFDFKAPRLKDRSGKGFFSYADPYATSESAQPYVYFSNYGDAASYLKYGTSDCASLGVAPYILSAVPLRFHSPTSYQILSAGADRQFGPGGLWPDSTGSIHPNGRDDHSNFNDGRLMGIRD